MSHTTAPSDSKDSSNPDEQRAQRLKGIALVCMALMCFACLDATAKWLGPRIGPIETTWARYLSSVVIVSFVLNPWVTPGITITKKPWMQVTRSLLLFLSTTMNFLALQHLQLSQTMSIMFLAPLMVALLSGFFLGEWVGIRRIIAIGVGFIGILVVTRPGMGAVHPAAIFSVIGTVSYAFFAILTRILAAHDSSQTTMFYSGLGGLIILTPFVPFFWNTPENMTVVFFMVVIGAFGALGHWLWIVAHRFAPASVLSPFIYSQIIWMLLLGYFIFNDVPDRWTLIGGYIVIASGLYLLHRERVTGRVVTNPGDPKTRQ
ncbi:MAG: DMT family transporter [Beijerinckiaceae bacterium]